jgi:hypothetical protein
MFYNQPWDNESNFDLAIDTNTISTEMATDWIIEAVRALSQKEFGPDAVTVELVKVDPALLDAINIALARQVPSDLARQVPSENDDQRRNPSPHQRGA